MLETLLKTKLYIPPARPQLVPRPHLTEQLNAGLHRKLSLISAPPGFGKTTLLSEWINGDLENNDQSPKFAWVSLDQHDNDPVRFWSYMITALNTIEPDVGADALNLLHAPQPPPIETTLTTLINAVTRISHKFVLILDDYHVIENESIHEALNFLLDHLPPQMHLTLTSRNDPPLPLTRLRVRNQLTELRDSDLRFSLTEMITFLNQVMGLNLTPDDIMALERRTEGWIAGLQLAALSMQGRGDTPNFMRAFTGSHRYVIDYLAEEVLSQQPEPVQHFLLHTSILNRLCGPLCDELVSGFKFEVSGLAGNPKPQTQRSKPPDNSQEILERLEQANLFIIPLDAERRWYRYHHLFADFLQEQLRQQVGEAGMLALHHKASIWHAENGLTGEAINHALAANEPEYAAHLVEQITMNLLISGEVTTLLTWLEQLPDTLIRARPRLALGKAWALVITNRWDTVELLVQAAEKELSAADQQNKDVLGMWGEVSALQAMLVGDAGDIEQSIQLCWQALEHLPQDNLIGRSIITMTLGTGYQLAGNLEKAGQILQESLALAQQIDSTSIILTTTGSLGQIHKELGQLHQAAEYYRLALDPIEKRAREQGHPNKPLPIAGGAYLNMAEVLREWNNLEAAQRYLTIGLQLGEQLNALGGSVAVGYLILARILQAQGDQTGAMQTIEQAIQALTPDSPVRLWVKAIQARLWLAQGNVAAAAQWAENCELPLDDDFNYLKFPGEYATLVRVMIAQEEFDRAKELLRRMRTTAETHNRAGRLLEVVMLQALLLHAQGNTEQALTPLARALSLGKPGGYVRLFVDEGKPMARLLHLAKTRNIAPNYVDKLLAAFPPDVLQSKEVTAPKTVSRPASASNASTASSANQQLVEPLSERELEVLNLVADGLSNREIAEKLFITVGTAKTHTVNIYRKLDVRSRTQAVAKATELGLL